LIEITEEAFELDDDSYGKLVEKIGAEFNESMIWSKQIQPYLNCLRGCLQ
jgi:hypothetical protein